MEHIIDEATSERDSSSSAKRDALTVISTSLFQVMYLLSFTTSSYWSILDCS
jgi:hypothetical protein